MRKSNNIAPINPSRIGQNAPPPTVARQGLPAASSVFPRNVQKPGRVIIQKSPIISKPTVNQPVNSTGSSIATNSIAPNNVRNAMNNLNTTVNNTNKASFLIRKSNTLAKSNVNNNNNNNPSSSNIPNPAAINTTTTNRNSIQGIPSRPGIIKQTSSNNEGTISNNNQQSTQINSQIQPSSQSSIPQQLSHQNSSATTTASVTQSISSIPISANPTSPQQSPSQVFTSPLVQNRRLVSQQQPSLVSQPSSNNNYTSSTNIQPLAQPQAQPPAVVLPQSNIFQSTGPSSIQLQRNRNIIPNPFMPPQQVNSGDSSNSRGEATSIRQPTTVIQRRPDTPVPNLEDIAPSSVSNAFSSQSPAQVKLTNAIFIGKQNLAGLAHLRLEREAAAARRQQFEERMNHASRVVRQQMRNEYRNRNGRDMSESSSGEEQEEQKEDTNHRSQQRQPIRGRAMSDGSEEEEEEEQKENDVQLRRNNHNNEPANASRRTVASSMPPVRNMENSIHQLQFRRPQMPPSPLYQPPRPEEPEEERSSNRENNRNPNNSDQPQQPSIGGGVRLMIPLMQLANLNGNSGNPRQITGITLAQLMELFTARLNSLQGPITGSTLQEISQIAATMRLLQGAFSQQIPRGLSVSQIKDFPVVTLKTIDKDEICSVCLEDWKINDEAKLLGCMHKFHSHCIDSWLKSSTICPNCKQNQLEFFEDKIPESLLQK